jgi:hypothetical protein
MKLEVFKEIVDKLKEQDEILDKTYKAGIDLTNLLDPIQTTVSHLIGSIYGKEGLETFDWWCHDKEWGTRKDTTMTDDNDNKLCETIEDLHKYLEENATGDYNLPKRLTAEERLEVLKNMFGSQQIL